LLPLDLQLHRYRDALRITHSPLHTLVWDPVRRGHYVLTPEELVRQLMLCYLLEAAAVPPGRISVEKKLRIHGRIHRYDIVVYDKSGEPLLLMECKKPEQNLRPRVLSQIGQYNRALQVPYLVVTNGIDTYCLHRPAEAPNYHPLSAFPEVAGV
jgi:hypothetical protein